MDDCNIQAPMLVIVEGLYYISGISDLTIEGKGVEVQVKLVNDALVIVNSFWIDT